MSEQHYRFQINIIRTVSIKCSSPSLYGQSSAYKLKLLSYSDLDMVDFAAHFTIHTIKLV